MARTLLDGRIVASRRHALLAVGDLLVVVLFAAIGEYRHGGALASVAETALQFGVGWIVVAPFVGAYGARALEGRLRAAGIGAGTWAAAAVVGVLVRYATEPGASLDPVFVLVTIAVGAVLFAGWRAIAARP